MARQARRTYASTATAAALALILTACASLGSAGSGGAGDQPEPTTEPVPTEAGEGFWLQIAHVGGFMPMGWDFSNVPQITIYPDGLAVTHGPQTMEYPGRFLPHLLTHELSDEELAGLVTAARDAGLLEDAPDYGMPPVADAGATVLTIRVDGETYVHQAEALEIMLDPGFGQDGEAMGLTADAVAARETLAAFIDTTRAAVDGAQETGTYEPGSYAYLAVEVPPLTEADGMDVMPTVHPWPLAEPLAETACTVVEGADAQTLGAALQEARQNDRFEQGGTQFQVFVRPLLPGEDGCTGTEQLPAGG